jgi:hypothetical protein
MDAALYAKEKYIQSIKFMTIRSNYINLHRIREAEMQIALKHYDQALPVLLEELNASRNKKAGNITMRLLLDIGRAYEGKKSFANAFYYTKSLIENASANNVKHYLRDGYKLMSLLYDQVHNIDSAYIYYRKYTLLNQSVALDEFSKKLAIYKAAAENEKKQVEVDRLSNEKLIDQQQIQLGRQALKTESLIRTFLSVALLVAGLLGVMLFKSNRLRRKNESNRLELAEKELGMQKLESEKLKTDLLQQATKLEMQTLRAQMNPHFIFNSLNSINRFILQNDREQASENLSKFSQLVRLILQNSQSALVPLESELEALQLYLELESTRFDNHFDFNISIDEGIDLPALKVPPLIIQPYAENAIWHGLMHKREKGHLGIDLFEDKDMLCCKITDDGVGRRKAAELKSKSSSSHKSMGMQITAARVSMLQNGKQSESQIKITDLVLDDGTAVGTEVLIKIPALYD